MSKISQYFFLHVYYQGHCAYIFNSLFKLIVISGNDLYYYNDYNYCEYYNGYFGQWQ